MRVGGREREKGRAVTWGRGRDWGGREEGGRVGGREGGREGER